MTQMVKNPPAMQETWVRSLGPPGEGNVCSLQYACLGNPMDRGAWWAAVHSPRGRKEPDTTERLTVSLSLLRRDEAWFRGKCNLG